MVCDTDSVFVGPLTNSNKTYNEDDYISPVGSGLDNNYAVLSKFLCITNRV